MTASSPLNTRDRIKAIQEFIAAGRHDEAEALLDDLASGARDPDALNARAALALARRKVDAAFELLSEATTAYPDHAGLATNLGICYELLGRFDEAVLCLERAAALAPGNEDIKLSLAHALVSRGDIDEAQQIAVDAVTRDPANARAFVQLGTIQLAKQDRVAAEALLQRGLELSPDDPATLRNLSAVQLERGRFDEALALAERAHLRAPLDLSTLLHLAYCRAAAARWTEAEATCRKILAYAPSHTGAREILARVKIATGDVEGGIAELTRNFRARKSDLSAAMALARALQMTGRFEDALKVATHAAGMEPGNANAESLKATLELCLGRFPAPVRASLLHINPVFVPPTTGPLEFVALARCLKHVAARQALRVIAEPHYQALLSELSETVIPETPHPSEKVTPLQTLIQVLPLTNDNVADDIPYLRPDPRLLAKWQPAIGEIPGPRVGIVWDGGTLSLSMEQIASTLPDDATPVSLVMDDHRHDLRGWGRAIDAGVHIQSPAELIAAIACLDAVIGPDGFAMHIAGALGLPGVVLVPCGYPWYWAQAEGRALWYPSVVVAVQDKLGDWDPCLAQAKDRLAKILRAAAPA